MKKSKKSAAGLLHEEINQMFARHERSVWQRRMLAAKKRRRDSNGKCDSYFVKKRPFGESHMYHVYGVKDGKVDADWPIFGRQEAAETWMAAMYPGIPLKNKPPEGFQQDLDESYARYEQDMRQARATQEAPIAKAKHKQQQRKYGK